MTQFFKNEEHDTTVPPHIRVGGAFTVLCHVLPLTPASELREIATQVTREVQSRLGNVVVRVKFAYDGRRKKARYKLPS